ncbi:MAG: hypothetical protein FD131_3304 [Rhodocyclaceae bacterium]|nr:MAG: hypothetical protein FD131_3304 [Rhodocyclaceae bacterium]
MDTREQIEQAIKQMLDAGESISISAVAEKCDVSHSLIYNRYPDLKEKIKELKSGQKARQKTESDEALISTLLAKNKALQEKVKSETSGQAEEAFKSMLSHVQQVYSMYDQLLDDRNKLAERLGRGQ